MTNNKEWFASWFDTSYYHILYSNRDYSEAQEFMQNIVSFLQLKKEKDLLLDLGCGKGRHSIYLNSLGFNVVGADLSKNSIKEAKKFENSTLQFIEHDMRNPFINKYNAILNLFTSFGFFEDNTEDIAILQNIKNGLKTNGIAIIDFMNVKKVISNLVEEETKTINGITFEINRYLKNGFIIKEINFDADGKQHTYFEKVKCLDLPKIKLYLNSVNFKIKHTFGNYQLDDFDEEISDRLILVLE
ncbi:MAG: methyltransferase domain-containing protein [Lutibacter sp.]|uniref:methyltransferase domain-containing protein n=1 Tax=Lutibacter sp. TaxID=1925666 RepID=UPI00385EF3A4